MENGRKFTIFKKKENVDEIRNAEPNKEMVVIKPEALKTSTPAVVFDGVNYYTPEGVETLRADVNNTFCSIQVGLNSRLRDNYNLENDELTQEEVKMLMVYKDNRDSLLDNLFGPFFLTADSLYKRLVAEINEVISTQIDMMLFPPIPDYIDSIDFQLDMMVTTFCLSRHNDNYEESITFEEICDIVIPYVNSFGVGAYNKIRKDLSNQIYLYKLYYRSKELYDILENKFKLFMADLVAESGTLCNNITKMFELINNN